MATINVTSTNTLTVVGDPPALELAIEPGEVLPPASVLVTPWSRAVEAARAQRDRLRPLTSRALAPVAVWAIAATAALAVTHAGASGALGIGIAGALISLTLLGGRLGGRLVAAAAMAPVAFAATAPTISWVLAGALVAGVAASGERPLVARSQDLQRHLDWCRRREERAHVLVVLVPEAEAGNERGLLEAFRLTDSVAISHHQGRCEIQAVIDHHRLSREGLERRVIAAVGDQVEFGWAEFPEEGFTLEVLLERAASGLALSDDHPVAANGRFEPVQQPA